MKKKLKPKFGAGGLTRSRDTFNNDVGRMIAYGQLRGATRCLPQIARMLPVCVGFVIQHEKDLKFYHGGVCRLTGQDRDYGLRDDSVGIDTLATQRDRTSAETDSNEYLRDRVFAIAVSRDLFPAGFDLSADLIIELKEPSPRVVAASVKRCLGVQMTEEQAIEVAGYPLYQLAKAFRRNRTVARSLEVLRGLRKAEAVRNPVVASQHSLDDLPGMGPAAEWGRQLAVDLKDWKSGKIRWSDVDRGVLISGPPGCGKTIFASALATTCKVELVLGSLARWQAKGHMGDLLKAMRAAFAEAIAKQPCILFVDELDSFGDRERLAATSAHNEQYSREVVNGFLECLDGAGGREGVVVVGATNFPDMIDAAIKRPGRLDRHIEIPLPDKEARAAILRLHLGVDLDQQGLVRAAERSAGRAGARLGHNAP